MKCSSIAMTGEGRAGDDMGRLPCSEWGEVRGAVRTD